MHTDMGNPFEQKRRGSVLPMALLLYYTSTADASISLPGVSLITQDLYALVFCTRYLDLFWTPPFHSWWNFFFKIFYIASSLYIIFIMMRVYARTREREKAWRLGAYCLIGSMIAAPFVTLIFRRDPRSRPPFEVCPFPLAVLPPP